MIHVNMWPSFSTFCDIYHLRCDQCQSFWWVVPFFSYGSRELSDTENEMALEVEPFWHNFFLSAKYAVSLWVPTETS